MPTIAAAPFPYEFPAHGLALIVIDMQRDFLEPGGFGEALGNNVAPLAAIIPEVCVQTTMREANDRGYECLLVEDATASYFPAFKQATLEMIRAQGAIVGWTATAADVLRALEQCQA